MKKDYLSFLILKMLENKDNANDITKYLAVILDFDSFVKFLMFFGGLTVKIPTFKSFVELLKELKENVKSEGKLVNILKSYGFETTKDFNKEIQYIENLYNKFKYILDI